MQTTGYERAAGHHDPGVVGPVTVLFTDIVGSTHTVTRLGDQGWRAVLARHDQLVRAELARHGGREVNTTGDGFIATFDSAERGVVCAMDIRDRVRSIGLEIRAGLHAGEVAVLPDAAICGLTLHIAARTQRAAAPGEVVVTRAVTDLIAGSDLRFHGRGQHTLRGLPGRWCLYAAAS